MSTLDVATGRAFFMGLQQRIMAEVLRLDGAQPISDA